MDGKARKEGSPSRGQRGAMPPEGRGRDGGRAASKAQAEAEKGAAFVWRQHNVIASLRWGLLWRVPRKRGRVDRPRGGKDVAEEVIFLITRHHTDEID